MAKLRPSIIKLRGSIMGVTIVESKRYGRHGRAERGTYTPITINAEFEKSKERLLSCNKPAKLIFDAVRYEHKGGELWTDLVSVFRKQLKAGKSFHFKDLLKLECHHLYSLNKILANEFAVTVNSKRKKMQVTVNLHRHPQWEKKDYLDGYQLSVMVLFPDLNKDHCQKEVVRAAVVSFKDALQPFHFDIPMPATTARWILLLGVDGAEKGEINGVCTTRTLAVVKVSDE